MPKLTKRAVDAIGPNTKPIFLWDSEVPGFGLCVLPSGTKSFVLQFRTAQGRSRRMTLGRYGAMTVDEARDRARVASVAIRDGNDPLAQRDEERSALVMADLFDRYLQDHVAVRNAASTQRSVASLVEKHLRPAFGSLPIKSFALSDASRLHHSMRATPRSANHALAILSTALGLAETWGLRPMHSNPCALVRRYPEEHRKRFLSEPEINRLGEALALAESEGLPWRVVDRGQKSKHIAKEPNRRTPVAWQVVATVRLLLLTGARLGEIITMEWSHVDLRAGKIALPSVKGKGREPHPVSAAALALLAGLPRQSAAVHVLPRTSDATRHVSKEVVESGWQRIRAHCGLDDVRLHDLRHTVGTYAAQAGVSGFIVRDLLRHRHIATTGRYANFDADPVRHVSDVVGERIAEQLKT